MKSKSGLFFHEIPPSQVKMHDARIQVKYPFGECTFGAFY